MGYKMVNLEAIEKRLNSDPSAMSAFLENPVLYFTKEGITLSAEMAEELSIYIARQPDLIKREAAKKIVLGIVSNNSAGLMDE